MKGGRIEEQRQTGAKRGDEEKKKEPVITGWLA